MTRVIPSVSMCRHHGYRFPFLFTVFYVSLMIHQLLGHECFYEKRQGLFSANCPTDVEEVPYDLDPSIEVSIAKSLLLC